MVPTDNAALHSKQILLAFFQELLSGGGGAKSIVLQFSNFSIVFGSNFRGQSL